MIEFVYNINNYFLIIICENAMQLFLKKNVYAHGYSMKNKTQIIIVFVNMFLLLLIFYFN